MKKELGKWLLDIAKYVVTAIVISNWLSGFSNWDWYFSLLTIVIIAVVVIFSLKLIGAEENQSKNKKEKKK